MATNVETERPYLTDKLGQGDILKIEYSREQTGPALGVVINADCDLANGKTDGTVAYLPIYSFREYLAQFFIPAYLERIATESTRRITELTNAGPTGPDDLSILLGLVGEEEATTRLCGLEGVKRKDHNTIGELIRKLCICRDETAEPYNRFERLCRQDSNPQKRARTHIEEAYRGLSDGHFFLSELVDQS